MEEMQYSINLWQKYLEWVSLHPHVAMEMETGFKFLSYLATGKYLIYYAPKSIWGKTLTY